MCNLLTQSLYPADPFSPSLATGQTPKLPPLPSSAGPSSQSIAIAGPGQLPSSGGPPAGSAAGPSGPGPAYEGGALGLVPVNAGALTPTQQSSFPDNLDPHNVPPEFKKEGSDWFAIFNHKVKRVLDVTLVHTLMHERWVSFVYVVRGCRC